MAYRLIEKAIPDFGCIYPVIVDIDRKVIAENIVYDGNHTAIHVEAAAHRGIIAVNRAIDHRGRLPMAEEQPASQHGGVIGDDTIPNDRIRTFMAFDPAPLTAS